MKKNPISSNKPKRQDDAYTVYKQCKKSTSDRCLIHVFQLRTVCTGPMHGPAADLGVNLRDEVKQKAWGSLGGGWGERQGRNADQGEMERQGLLRSPVQHLIRKKEHSKHP